MADFVDTYQVVEIEFTDGKFARIKLRKTSKPRTTTSMFNMNLNVKAWEYAFQSVQNCVDIKYTGNVILPNPLLVRAPQGE